MDKQWTNFDLAWSATSSNKYTTIHLFEGEGGNDDNGNSNVVIAADSKVGERQRCNELEMIAAEEDEWKPTIMAWRARWHVNNLNYSDLDFEQY